MFSNLSVTDDQTRIAYPISDSKLPFAEYIKQTRTIIEERRLDLTQAGEKANLIIHANSPFELYPVRSLTNGKRIKAGALLIHGLLDSPFTFRDIAKQFQQHGILSRAILLPGHGTRPSDLIYVTYHQWIQAVRYAIETLSKEVDQIYLVGYSTGATLSLYEAMQDSRITGVVLLSPAIRIKAPVDIAVSWYKLLHMINHDKKDWMYRDEEIDYAKYRSIPFNAVSQVSKLTQVIHDMREQEPLKAPMLMIMSREDETVSSHSAINFFNRLPNTESELLLYSSVDHRYQDSRIKTRVIANKQLGVAHFSHTSIPFSPENAHYGENGDYIYASKLRNKQFTYGAYNRLEERLFELCNLLHLAKSKRRELTFNPDFAYMTTEMVKFISGETTPNS